MQAIRRWRTGRDDLITVRSVPVAATEQQIVGLRDAHPAWGARKLAHRLKRNRQAIPAISTVHEILRRYDRVSGACGHAWTAVYSLREGLRPISFGKWTSRDTVPLENGVSLSSIDDRWTITRALPCAWQPVTTNEATTVRGHLETTFHRYGLPDAMFVDNGGPWGFTLEDPWTTADGVASQARRPHDPQPALSSPEPGQERTVPPHA